MLSDDEIAALTFEERRDLMQRLEGRPTVPDRLARRLHTVRRVRLVMMTASALTLVPWTIYLAFALPPVYEAHNWRLAWVGFDVILMTSMAATAWLAWRMRQLVILASFTTGVLLVCDAWFDVTTAAPGERIWSILSAVFVELPLAFTLTYGARRLLRVIGEQRLLIAPGQRLRQVPIKVRVDRERPRS